VRALNGLTLTTALATGLLCAGHPGTAAATDTLGEAAPIVQVSPDISVLPIGVIKPDSVLEVDRSANAARGVDNNVGSDLEGGPED